METLHNQLLAAIDKDDLKTATQILATGIDLNVPCAELDGAPALFFAILKGNYTIVQLLLEHGADPNYRADEPVASLYTAKPLDLARQARMLMDWEKYHVIVKLLEQFGATYEDGQVDSTDLVEKSKTDCPRL
ncbi:MAG TPA: ankyrin repeat domain-containing protein [Pyrinomonadaceae bacterium]